MGRVWKVICLVAVLALVLVFGIVLAPSMLGGLGAAMTEPPSPPPPPPPPVAGFTGQPTLGTGPLIVQFTESSSGATSWLWDFGDGQTSHQQNPNHTYYTEGIYQVTLTVTGEGGTATEYRSSYVMVDAGAAPGRVSVRNLLITPTYANPDQQVTVSADVVNIGGSPASLTVNLVINGQFEQSRTVSVSPSTAYPVSFTVYKANPGTYQVIIGDAVGWFYVMQSE